MLEMRQMAWQGGRQACRKRFQHTGTLNVSVSTGTVDAACTRATTCNGISSTTLQAGQTYYYALEESGGGCKTVDFLISMP
jgi:hypothetical protein